MDSVRGTYDVYTYEAEKRAALSRLDRILNPTDNVFALRSA
jgi:hypothetical protein